MTRRQFFGLGFGWIPFFRRRRETLAGIRFRIVRRKSTARRYIHIHGNEATARQVLEEHIKRRAGMGFVIENVERNAPLDGGAIDPNRMFSREGAERSLRSLNRNWSDAQFQHALDRLDRERDKFVRRVLPPAGGRIVALHNNSSGYSVRTEVPISDETALNDAANPHEFMLATDPADFRILAQSPFNVVLQSRAPVDDDGSLSRLAAKRGVRYVNIEAGLGKLDRQREMLAWLEEKLP